MLKFLFLLVFTLTIQSYGINDSLNINKNCTENYIDSIFVSTGIDTSEIKNYFLTANTKDWLKNESIFTIKETGCTDYLIFFPDINNSFDPLELDILMSMENPDEKLFFYFIEDNLIRESLHKVFVDENNELIKMVRLSIDVNVDFAEVISVSYYKDKLLRFYINNYCERFGDIKIIRIFNYDKFEIISEEIILISKDKAIHKIRNNEDITENIICQ